MSSDRNSGPDFILAILVLLIIAAVVFLFVKTVAGWFHVPWLVAAKALGFAFPLMALVAFAVWKEWISAAMAGAILGAGLWMCGLPVLNEWAGCNIDPVQGFDLDDIPRKIEWYGRWWFQVPMVFVLGFAGLKIGELISRRD